MIKLDTINHRYKDGDKIAEIFNDFSLEIDNGLTLIVGPSGCGKTTLLNILGGLLEPTSGHLFIDEINYYDLGRKERNSFRREKCGYVFQDFYLLDDLSPIDNVLLVMNGTSPYNDKKSKAINLLSQLGLEERINWKITNLSGGERQRIAIARALSNDSKYLFCDEPTGNLDEDTALGIMNIFVQLSKQNKSVIMVTHNTEYIKYADQIIDLRKRKESL